MGPKGIACADTVKNLDGGSRNDRDGVVVVTARVMFAADVETF